VRARFVLSALILLSFTASAWGPATQRYICDEAVKQVWGQDAVVQCLPKKSSKFMGDFCEHLYRMKGADVYARCKSSFQKRDFIHPANMVDELFNDTELWHDYGQCPVRPGPARYLMCGTREDAPAPKEAEHWFEAALKASDTCMQVYDFCIGASYYAKGENPVNQIVEEKESCYEAIVDGVENAILAGKESFRVSKRCEFEHSDYEQDIVVTDNRIKNIISSLVASGKNLSVNPTKEAGNVVLLANSIDYELNRGLLDYLTANGIAVTRASAEEFKTLRYSACVVVLGGHHAPEGVGEVVDALLNSEEKENLTKNEGEKIRATREDVWMLQQKVIVLAGQEKEDTRGAVEENRDGVVSELKTCV